MLARATLNLGAAAALAATVWFAIAGTGLTLPELAVVAPLFARVMSALMNLQDSAQEFANALPAYGYTQEALRALQRATEDAAGANPSTGKREEPPGPCRDEPRMALHAALTVRAVSFDYEPRAQTGARRRALSGVDLDVQAGKITAISGPSGAGKSTLADVLLGLLDPTSGSVLVDGVPLDRSNRRRWRRSCAYVPQDPYLFHDTVRANVAWARPHANDRDVWRALRRAAAADFVAKLPQGLDTVVGDRGGRLSGGERQRIVLARALLLKPTLLVLDEATSQLDTRTEQRVVEALRSLRGRTTVVAMAHREALMAAADRIVLLDSGRVAATRAPGSALDGAGDNDFCGKVARAILEHAPRDVAALARLDVGDADVEAARLDLISKIGENVQVRRFLRLQPGGSCCGAYRHGSRIGVLVDVAGGDDALARDLAMHIAATRPLCVAKDDAPAELLAREREILTARAEDSGKPAAIVARMVEGRLDKYIRGIALLEQPFVKDDERTVGALLGERAAAVRAFHRYEVGEGIEKKKEDFAAEVMAQARGG